MKRFLPLVALGLILSGCVANDTFDPRDEVRRYDKMDAAKAASARMAIGNWRFLAWVGGGSLPTLVPGLTKEEVHEFVESGRVGLDLYYFYAADANSSADHLAIRDAKMRYASRVNRCIVDEIRRRMPPATPAPVTK
ncbi:MAG TPA: hypothetical protein VHD32_16600 [Candidatus Didemnitutus sp.]|nr:hypothetical protein [Candidatus Didemnitutus sp.]